MPGASRWGGGSPLPRERGCGVGRDFGRWVADRRPVVGTWVLIADAVEGAGELALAHREWGCCVLLQKTRERRDCDRGDGVCGNGDGERRLTTRQTAGPFTRTPSGREWRGISDGRSIRAAMENPLHGRAGVRCAEVRRTLPTQASVGQFTGCPLPCVLGPGRPLFRGLRIPARADVGSTPCRIESVGEAADLKAAGVVRGVHAGAGLSGGERGGVGVGVSGGVEGGEWSEVMGMM